MANRKFVTLIFVGLVLCLISPTRVFCETGLLFDDVVVRISGADGKTQVVFKHHAAIYVVVDKNPKFKVLVHALEESARTQVKVVIEADPTSLEISSVKVKTDP